MYNYLVYSTFAAISSMTALTITNSKLISKIEPEYYLGKDIPGQLISLSASILLSYRYKSNLIKLGVITSSMFPISIFLDLIASESDSPSPYLFTASVLRSISFVGPAGTHTSTIVNICKNTNPVIFGNRNMVLTSLGATAGLSYGIYLSKKYENNNTINPIIISCIYPISLYLGWKKYT